MKKMIVLIAAMTLLSVSVGCSGSGLLSQFKSRCSGGCQTPPVNPSFGYPAGDCNSSAAEGEFIGGGQVIDAGNSTSYMNDSYIQSDPYMSGSNSGGATINPPVFDSYSGPSYGSFEFLCRTRNQYSRGPTNKSPRLAARHSYPRLPRIALQSLLFARHYFR